MNEYQTTGGARIGRANASIPLAKLKVSKDKLELNASLIGNLVFQPKDVISIEPYIMIPIIGQGIRINHRVPDYKGKIIFWSLQSPSVLIKEIEKTGFMANMNLRISENDEGIIARQKQGGFPMKKSVAIAAVMLWNLLFAFDFISFFNNPKMQLPVGIGIKSAIALSFSTALLTLFSDSFRKMILKEGRSLDDVRSIFYLILFISGVLLVSVSFIGIQY